MTVTNVLDALAAWAEDGSQFTTEALARDRWRHRVAPWSRGACRWCVAGKLEHLGGIEDDAVAGAWTLVSMAATALGYEDMTDCNDQGGLPAVRQMIARARAEAGACC